MEKIEAQLKKLNPELSMHESQVLWSRVEGRLSPRGARSPKKSARRSVLRAITAGAVILGLLGGSVVTAYASESLPGDTLYSTKLTIERAQIILAPVEKKKELQLAFADRRVKEVSAVLADIEEEESPEVPEVTMAMAMTAPVADTASADLAQATLAIAPAEAPEASEGGVATFAMNVAPAQESQESKVGEHQETNVRTTARAKSMVPTPMMMKDAPASSTQEEVAVPPQAKKFNIQKGKRWKNLDKKKKALTVAIQALERSSKELEKNGETSTSERVDEVIVSLTELNTTGTTADDTFVEKMKNSEVEVLPPAAEEEKPHQEEEHEAGEHDSSLLPQVEPESQGGAAVLSLDAKTSIETEKEIEEVKVRNAERRKKLQISERNQASVGRWKAAPKMKRVPVCMDQGSAPHEILVFERDVARFVSRGFTKGSCPTPIPTALPETEVSATTSLPAQ